MENPPPVKKTKTNGKNQTQSKKKRRIESHHWASEEVNGNITDP
jgi:hypothetical protein